MSALLELIKEAPPEDRKAAAELLKPYMSFEKEEPKEDSSMIGRDTHASETM